MQCLDGVGVGAALSRDIASLKTNRSNTVFQIADVVSRTTSQLPPAPNYSFQSEAHIMEVGALWAGGLERRGE